MLGSIQSCAYSSKKIPLLSPSFTIVQFGFVAGTFGIFAFSVLQTFKTAKGIVHTHCPYLAAKIRASAATLLVSSKSVSKEPVTEKLQREEQRGSNVMGTSQYPEKMDWRSR